MSESQQQVEFFIQKVYAKDISFEAPDTFKALQATWNPETNVELHTNANNLEESTYEVDLSITLTARNEQQTAFIVEITQSGIFTINGLPENQLGHMLGSYCPNILFPYAREAITGLVARAGFPQLNLAPVNFDALYAQSVARQNEETATRH